VRSALRTRSDRCASAARDPNPSHARGWARHGGYVQGEADAPARSERGSCASSCVCRYVCVCGRAAALAAALALAVCPQDRSRQPTGRILSARRTDRVSLRGGQCRVWETVSCGRGRQRRVTASRAGDSVACERQRRVRETASCDRSKRQRHMRETASCARDSVVCERQYRTRETASAVACTGSVA
jgi:hypothetical protein